MTPPLRIWRNAMIFVVGAIGYLWLYFLGNNSPTSQTAIFYQEKIESFHRTGKDTITVVVLGSSLALNAFGAVPDIPINCAPVKILRLTINGLNMEAIHAFGILETLANFPPNYLIFESNLLVRFSKESSQLRFMWVYNLLYLRNDPISFIFRDNYVMANKIGIAGENLSQSHLENKRDKVYSKLRKSIRYKLTEQENTVIDQPFRKLVSRKVKIILLRYPVIETTLYKNIVPKFIEKIENYKKEYGVVCWEIPWNQVQNDLFYDGAHMNQKGSSVFVPWFLGRLNQELCNN